MRTMTSVVLGEHSSSWPLPSGIPDREEIKQNGSPHPNGPGVDAANVARSASSNELASLSRSAVTSNGVSLPRTLSENVLTGLNGQSPRAGYNGDLEDREKKPRNKDQWKVEGRKVAGLASTSEAAEAQSALDSPDTTEDDGLEMRKMKGSWPPAADGKRRSMSRSLSRLARRSWMSSSRSPSPSPSDHLRAENGSTLSKTPSLTSTSSSSSVLNAQESPMASRQSAKGQRRPTSTLMDKVDSEPTVPSVPTIPKSFSSDRLPIVRSKATEKTPTLPASVSVERLQNMGIETSRKKDELWGAFRTLDGDFQKHVTFISVRL